MSITMFRFVLDQISSISKSVSDQEVTTIPPKRAMVRTVSEGSVVSFKSVYSTRTNASNYDDCQSVNSFDSFQSISMK